MGDLSLATNRTWRDKRTNELQEKTTFVNITVWGQQAETCKKYLAKGREIMVEGRLELDQWEDKETGKNRSKLYVVADRIQFLGGRGEGGAGGAGGAGGDRESGARESRGYNRSYNSDESFGRGYDGGRYGSGDSGGREKTHSKNHDDDDIPF